MADAKISALSASTTPLAGTEVLPIVQGGATVKVSVDNLTTGKIVPANAIKFPATQSTSSDANTLDDYEEGTFAVAITPTSGSVTMNFTVLQYTKVGRQVTITGECNIDSVSLPSGDVTIGNLPFPNSANSQRSSNTSFYIRAYSFTGAPLGICAGYINANASVIDVSAINDFVGASIGANLQAGTTFIFAFSYMTTT